MNNYLVAAGVLTILVGLIHSFLGEKLIFAKLRKGQIVPTLSAAPLRERNVRIIWASWHIVTIFGFGFAALLFLLASPSSGVDLSSKIKNIVAMPMFLSSLLVLYSTKAKHPGWVCLLAIGILVWII